MENPIYSLLKIINKGFEPGVPLDDKVNWKSYNKARDYCDEIVEGEQEGDIEDEY